MIYSRPNFGLRFPLVWFSFFLLELLSSSIELPLHFIKSNQLKQATPINLHSNTNQTKQTKMNSRLISSFWNVGASLAPRALPQCIRPSITNVMPTSPITSSISQASTKSISTQMGLVLNKKGKRMKKLQARKRGKFVRLSR